MEQIENLVTICTLVISFSTIINVVLVFKSKAEEPERNQNDRISALEKRMDQVEAEIEENKSMLLDIEAGMQVTHKALLALMSHALNGNNIDKLKEAHTELENHLVGRGHHE